MNEGWICPRCKKVNAPDVKQCNCDKNIEVKVDEIDFEEVKKFLDKERDKEKQHVPWRIGGTHPMWIYKQYSITSGDCPFCYDWYITC